MAEGRSEWLRSPMLPIAASFGYATSSIHIYGFGAFIDPITTEFGWSRTQVTSGLTIAVMMQLLTAIPIGMTVDRVGARTIGLLGILFVPMAYALIGTATGGRLNWYLLWFLFAITCFGVQSTVWSSAVASRFTYARGSALAVALCGASVASALFPWVSTRLIDAYGWRLALPGSAALWLAVAFPTVFFFFRDARHLQRGQRRRREPVTAIQLSGVAVREAVRSTIYARLAGACLLYSFSGTTLVILFIPMLTDGGLDRLVAAKCAAVIGVCSVVGRLGTGAILDRLPASIIGGIAFLLPPTACALLLAQWTTAGNAMIVAALIGITMGAEIDVIVYLLTRHFGVRHLGVLYAGVMMALAVGSSVGPLVAARIFDVTHSYDLFLWVAIACMLASSLALLTLPQPAPLEAPPEEEPPVGTTVPQAAVPGSM